MLHLYLKAAGRGIHSFKGPRRSERREMRFVNATETILGKSRSLDHTMKPICRSYDCVVVTQLIVAASMDVLNFA